MDPNNPSQPNQTPQSQPLPPASPGMPERPPAQPYAAQPGPAQGSAPSAVVSQKPKRHLRMTKPVWAVLIVLLLIIGAAAYYFGYHKNPSVIYSQSLKNTGAGYDKLISYAEERQKSDFRSTTGQGSFRIESDDFKSDGKMALKADKNNTQFSFDFGLAGNRVEFDSRFLMSSSGNPDIYLKAKGIKGLGTLIGNPALDTHLAALEDTWVIIDHSLLDSMSDQAGGGTAGAPPSDEQIIDLMRRVGDVNKRHVFTADQNEAVLKVVKNHGSQTIDGINTHHYETVINKDNAKKYLSAQRAAVKDSKLRPWLKANGYESMVDRQFDDMQEAVNQTRDQDRIHLWVNSDRRLVYKVRLPERKDPANRYLDIGLAYKGGDSYPFFVAGQSSEGRDLSKFNLTGTLDAKTDEIKLVLVASSTGREAYKFNASFTLKPSRDLLKVQKPSGAKPLAQVMSEIGLGGLLGPAPTPQPTGPAAQPQLPLSGEIPVSQPPTPRQ